MKKIYVKPTVEVVAIDSCTSILAESPLDKPIGSTTKGSFAGAEDLRNSGDYPDDEFSKGLGLGSSVWED